ncbi:abh1, partial [Symbiodinium microadriaticum]
AAICNFYHAARRPSDRLGGHRDDVEPDTSSPLVTVSLGLPCIFLLGKGSRAARPVPLLLRAGSLLVLAGAARQAYHGVPTVLVPPKLQLRGRGPRKQPETPAATPLETLRALLGSMFAALLWLPALLVASADHAEEAGATNLVQRRVQARFAEAVSAKRRLGDGKPWDVFDFVGAVHHKSGVSLLHKIWFYLFQGVLGARDDNMGVIMTPCYDKCRNTEAPIRWIVDTMSPELVGRQRASAKEKGKGLRVAGLVRDPVSMAVSAYCYHASGQEPFNVAFLPPGWPEVSLQNMSLEEGVAFVAERMLPYVVNMTDLFEDLADGMVFLHFETATSSSESFDKAVKELLDGLVGDLISNDEMEQALEAAKWADLQRHPEGADGHSSDPGCEAKVQDAFPSVVHEDILAVYRSLQKRLGYTVLQMTGWLEALATCYIAFAWVYRPWEREPESLAEWETIPEAIQHLLTKARVSFSIRSVTTARAEMEREAAFAKMVRAAVFLVLRLVASADHWFELGERQDDQGLSLLQSRSRQMPSETLDWEIADEPPSTNVCNGTSYNQSEEDCCAGMLYNLTTEGCCANQTIYAFDLRGCCNDKHVYVYGEEPCVNVPPSELVADFDCMADWPPTSYSDYWRLYCSAENHKAWAMTKSCKVGWVSVQQAGLEEAEAQALETCNKRAGIFDKETCRVFDRDGSECRRQRCGDEIYDASLKACCGGSIIDRVTEGCCGDVVYNTQTEGCCKGRAYPKDSYSCCGEQVLYDSRLDGCCLEDGPEVYRLGKQNCCRHPKGVCSIKPGQYSCCL